MEAVAVLDSITIRPPDEDREGVPAFGRTEFRYPQVLSGNAGNSYEHYRSWLGERSLVAERLPLFATGLNDVFAETDLLLALRDDLGRAAPEYSAARKRLLFGGSPIDSVIPVSDLGSPLCSGSETTSSTSWSSPATATTSSSTTTASGAACPRLPPARRL